MIDLQLDDFVDLISSTYKKATNELVNIQQFNQIKDVWLTRIKFKLAKYYPVRNEKKFEESSTFHTILDFNFILIDINEIRYMAQDSKIKLATIMSTQISDKIKHESEEIIFKLDQILKISKLWLETQCKWLFIEKCFQMPDYTNSYLDLDTLDQYFQIVKEFTVNIILFINTKKKSQMKLKKFYRIFNAK